MAKKKGGGKKKKKSKEEIEAERAAAEEAERIRLEEEAKRLAEEELLRKEREEEERLERARLRQEELQRLEDERLQTRSLAERRQRQLDAFLESREKEREWKAFLECSALPTPGVPGAQTNLNTYLQTVCEDVGTEVEDVMRQCQELQKVVYNFAAHRAQLAFDGDEDGALQTHKQILDLFAAQVRSVDNATAEILAHSDKYVSAKMEVLLGHLSDDFKLGVWINLASKGFRMKIIDFPRLSIIAEIPKTLALQSIAMRAFHARFDAVTPPASCGPDGVLKDYDTALGGLLFIETLKLPPAAKNVKGWTMRPINPAVHKSVQRLNFNAEQVSATPGDVGSSPPICVAVKFKVARDLVVRDIDGKHCQLVPADDMADEKVSDALAAQQEAFKEVATLRVGAWDPAQNCWTEDGISDVAFDPHSRVLSFSTARMTALAVLQKRFLDLPYRYWSLKPLYATRGDRLQAQHDMNGDADESPRELFGEDGADQEEEQLTGALLVLKCPAWIVKIEIGGDGLCKLLEPSEPELDHLRGRAVPPAELFSHLAASGINLLPPLTASAEEGGAAIRLETASGAVLQPKCSKLETHVYEELSGAVASSFTITASRWNTEVETDKCCVSLSEQSSAAADDTLELLALMRGGDNADEVMAAAGAEQGADGEAKDPEQPEVDDGDAAGDAAAAAAQAEGGAEGDADTSGEKKTEGEEGAAHAAEGKAGEEGETEAKTEAKAGEDVKASGERPGTGQSDASGSKKKKKGKKGKGKAKEEQEQAIEEAAPEEQEEKQEELEEEDPVASQPRTLLFEIDDEVKDTGIKCSFLRVRDSDEAFDPTLSKEQVTHVHLANALLAQGIYNEARVHQLEDNAESTGLRHAIYTVLQAIRPLNFTVVPRPAK